MPTDIRHRRVAANGIELHVATCGPDDAGAPVLLLLHGWPEFWLSWEPVMHRLADRFVLVAPDLRGFGDSDKPRGAQPSDQDGPATHAADMRALMAALGHARFGTVGHDVGAYVAQAMARADPAALSGLFFFDCPHPGIGARWIEPRHIGEIWYQSFHQQPWAAALVGASRDSCRTYLSHFLRHWSVRQDAFEDVLEQWVDTYLQPGNLQGGFNWYIAAAPARLAAMSGTAPALPPIALPACVRWGDSAVLPARWGEGLERTFSALDFAPLHGVGHFPHREDPDRAAAEIARFFASLPNGG